MFKGLFVPRMRLISISLINPAQIYQLKKRKNDKKENTKASQVPENIMIKFCVMTNSDKVQESKQLLDCCQAAK